MADEDPEGAIEEEVKRGAFSAPVPLADWRAAWDNATEEERGVWFRRGWLDAIGERIAGALEHAPLERSYDADNGDRRVLEFGDLGAEYLGGRRLVITIEAVPHTDLTHEEPDA